MRIPSLIFVTVLLLSLVLSACGRGNQPADEQGSEVNGVTTPTPVSVDSPVELDLEIGTELPAIPVDMPDEPRDRNGMFDEQPPLVIEEQAVYFAVFETAKGDITVELFADRAPETVNNFVYLARAGYYDGTTFHRVIPDFMAQGGDPTGTGTGGPGYQFADEFVANLGFDEPGLLAMANAGPGTNGSQFFLTHVPTTHLNQRHTIFGKIVDGMDALLRISVRDPQSAAQPGDTIDRLLIFQSSESLLPPPPPTPTPAPTPTVSAPALPEDNGDRTLADLDPPARAGIYNTPPNLAIDPDQPHVGLIETNLGNITLELFVSTAPDGVNNLAVLANLGYFDRLPFYANPDGLLLFGSLDGTTTNIGYSIPIESYSGEDFDDGVLGYFYPAENQPGHVQAGLLFLSVGDAIGPNQGKFIVGVVSEGLELLPLLRDDPEARIERFTVQIQSE